jgi:hypothetical protein
MELLESCPKCFREGISPTYHRANDPKCCDKNYFYMSDDEHLHYKCRCGFDFIKNVSREGEDT